jgi:Asp-tRNA(Asn)/Glu-tRNA(Gln) amidotransferase A subunit family amidase
MVPVAIGSQTAGSVVRPAAFCGTLGLKATRGLVDLTGVMALSANLDSLGWFAREGEDLAMLGAVLEDGWPGADADARPDTAPPAFAFSRTPWWDRADADSRRAVEDAARRLAAAGAPVRELELPDRFAPLPDAHDALMAFDAVRALAHEHEHHAGRLSDVLRALLDRGAKVERETADDAVALGAECGALLAEHLRPGEALLVPAVTGEPPRVEEHSTGDPWFCRPWTLAGVPALSVPGATGASGAPVGVQLVAPAGADAALASSGAWAAARRT